MLPRRLVPLSAMLLVACDPVFGDGVHDNTDYFPLDGAARVASYRSASGAMDWTLELQKADTSTVDGIEVVTLEYFDATSSDLLWQVRWSSDAIHGVRIHGFTDVQGQDEVVFDTPVVLIERGVQSEPVVTETNGFTFTASAGSHDGCETFWMPAWSDESCLVVSLSDADGLPGTHGVITGEYRLVPSYGPAWLDLDAYDDAWWMSDFDWEE